jgi:hypothetical protein
MTTTRESMEHQWIIVDGMEDTLYIRIDGVVDHCWQYRGDANNNIQRRQYRGSLSSIIVDGAGDHFQGVIENIRTCIPFLPFTNGIYETKSDEEWGNRNQASASPLNPPWVVAVFMFGGAFVVFHVKLLFKSVLIEKLKWIVPNGTLYSVSDTQCKDCWNSWDSWGLACYSSN